MRTGYIGDFANPKKCTPGTVLMRSGMSSTPFHCMRPSRFGVGQFIEPPPASLDTIVLQSAYPGVVAESGTVLGPILGPQQAAALAQAPVSWRLANWLQNNAIVVGMAVVGLLAFNLPERRR